MSRSEFSTDLASRSSGSKQPKITSRWVGLVLMEARLAFEQEMQRDRKQLDREFDRFWRSHRTQQV